MGGQRYNDFLTTNLVDHALRARESSAVTNFINSTSFTYGTHKATSPD